MQDKSTELARSRQATLDAFVEANPDWPTMSVVPYLMDNGQNRTPPTAAWSQ